MRWAYVYQNDLGKPSANLKQTLFTVQALNKSVATDFLCSRLDEKHLDFLHDYYKVEASKFAYPTGIGLSENGLFQELIDRLKFNRKALDILCDGDYDIIYTRDFGFLVYLWLVGGKKKLQGRVIYEPHKVYFRSSKKVPRFIEKNALKVVDGLVPITNGLLDDLINDFNLSVPKVVVPDGVEIHEDSGAQRQASSVEKPVQLIYAGSFKKWKGVHTIFEALNKLAAPSKFRLSICGGSEKDIAHWKNYCSKNGISEYVKFHGTLNSTQLLEEFNRSDVALLPNTSETISARYTSPLKLFEYLAAGLPIIASDLPSLKEILEEENAAFCSPEDPKQWASVFNEFALNSAWREKTGIRNKVLAKNYSWERRAEKIVKFVHEQF